MVILNHAEEVEFFLYGATIVSFVPLSVHVLSADGLLFCHVNCEPFADPSCFKKYFMDLITLAWTGKLIHKSCSLPNKIGEMGISAVFQSRSAKNFLKGN